MKYFKKNFLILSLSFIALEASNSNIYEYEIRFNNKIGPFSLDGLKTFTKTGKTFTVVFEAENKFLNAEINQLSEFSFTNSKVFPRQYNQKVKMPIKGQQNQFINFDFKNMQIISSGDINWVIDFSNNDWPLDPISSGFQIRQNLKMGIEEFEMNLLKLDEGTFHKNNPYSC